MRINAINKHTPSFGIRMRGEGLSALKKICINGGLSPKLYKKEMAKVQKIFPNSKDLLILNFLQQSRTQPFASDYHFYIATSYGHLYFKVPKNPKYTVAKFISACKELAQKCQN